MDPVTCRLLPFEVADGPTNMARDEALLRSATQGVTSLRFYGWNEATVSLGYFQSHQRHKEDPLLKSLPFVRRPSGGDALVHHLEVTYCLTLPAVTKKRSCQLASWMHTIIANALKTLGASAFPHQCQEPQSFDGTLCFQHFAAGDLLMSQGGRVSKVVGSAQKKQRGALMQHGGILLRQSPFTPALPGICDLSGVDIRREDLIDAILAAFSKETGWQIETSSWSFQELDWITELATGKYASVEWNCKR